MSKYAEGFVKLIKPQSSLPPKTSPYTASVYKGWFTQMRQADAFLHSKSAFMSAIVPEITVTGGDNTRLPRPKMLGTTQFMAQQITDYIQKTNVTHWLQYTANNIRGRTIKVSIMHCGDTENNATAATRANTADTIRKGVPIKWLNTYRSYVYKIYAWFYFIQPYMLKNDSLDCSSEISVYLYFTPFKKTLPTISGDTLGPSHANTGYTCPCSINPERYGGKTSTEIIIFRHEEWFKVLIHETMHNLELDFVTDEKTPVREIFPGIRHAIILSEAYAETWARLMNVAFYVFYDIYGGNATSAQYKAAVHRCLPAERTFSLFQANKILKYMGLSLNAILSSDAAQATAVYNQYSEKTNIFAYYIITGMLMFDADEFLKWCSAENKISLIRATQGETGCYKFKSLMSRIIKNERISECSNELSSLKQMPVHAHSARMTLWS